MDSCVTAAIARESHDLALLHASYGQRTKVRERFAFDAIADFYQVPERLRLVVKLDHFAQIGGSALTDAALAVPERDSAEAVHRQTAIPSTYVPFRMLTFFPSP